MTQTVAPPQLRPRQDLMRHGRACDKSSHRVRARPICFATGPCQVAAAGAEETDSRHLALSHIQCDPTIIGAHVMIRANASTSSSGRSLVRIHPWAPRTPTRLGEQHEHRRARSTAHTRAAEHSPSGGGLVARRCSPPAANPARPDRGPPVFARHFIATQKSV